MKRFTYVITLTMIFLFGFVMQAEASWDESVDGEYMYGDFFDNGDIYAKYIGADEDVYIPSEIDGVKIKYFFGVELKGHEWYEQGHVRKITIASSIDTVDSRVNPYELCTNLEEVTYEEGMKIIDDDWFDSVCLRFINVPESTEKIVWSFSRYYEKPVVIRYAGTPEQWEQIEKDIYDPSGVMKVHFSSHKTEKDYGIPASCGENGYRAGVYCQDCKTWTEGHDVVVSNLDHVYTMNYERAESSADFYHDEAFECECVNCEYGYGGIYLYRNALGSVTLAQYKMGYTGENLNPEVIVRDRLGNIISDERYGDNYLDLKIVGDYLGDWLAQDYIVKYPENMIEPGKYKIEVDFKGAYYFAPSVFLDFTIAPASPKPTATQTENSITLSWEKAVGATGYRVYSYNPTTKKYTKIASIKDTTYTVTNLNSGTKYYYAVKAYTKDDGTIWGDMSEVLTTATKPAKSTLTVKSASKGKATLSWTNVSGETGFQVYYKDSKDGKYKKYKTYSGNTVKATASSLTSGKTYYFKVRAYKKADGKTIYGSFSSAKSVKIK